MALVYIECQFFKKVQVFFLKISTLFVRVLMGGLERRSRPRTLNPGKIAQKREKKIFWQGAHCRIRDSGHSSRMH